MNKLDTHYTNLLHSINEYGTVKKDRTGTGTRSIFGYTIRHNMKDGFPLLTTKKMHWKSIATELLWFLRGDTNIKYLVDNGCHIWDGDAYKNYCNKQPEYWEDENGEIWHRYPQEEFINKIKTDDEFAKKWGELGPIYGKQWRSWNGVDKDLFFNSDELDERNKDARHGIFYKECTTDQIQNLINELKTNPDSRRLMISAWNVGELDQMVLPPCHYGFQVYTRELSDEERVKLYEQKTNTDTTFFPVLRETLDFHNIPTRSISLMWNQRSVDTFLGLPFNIASYGLLLEIIAKIVNMVPDQLIGNLGDTHLYLNHADAVEEQLGRYYSPDERSAMLKEAMGEEAYNRAVSELMPFGGGLHEYYEYHEIPTRTREPFPLPILRIEKTSDFWKGFDVSQFSHLDPSDFVVENYRSHSAIKAPLSN